MDTILRDSYKATLAECVNIHLAYFLFFILVPREQLPPQTIFTCGQFPSELFVDYEKIEKTVFVCIVGNNCDAECNIID